MRDEGPITHGLPWGVRQATTFFSKLYCRMMLYFQGTGRHTSDELNELRREAIGALADYAGVALAKTAANSSEPFWILGGDKPTEADFTLYGYLANCYYAPRP